MISLLGRTLSLWKTVISVLTLGNYQCADLGRTLGQWGNKNNRCFRKDVQYYIEVAAPHGSLGKVQPQNIGWFPPRKWTYSLSMILREKEIKDLWERKESFLLWRQGITVGLNSRKKSNTHGKSSRETRYPLSWDDGKPVRRRKTNLPPCPWGSGKRNSPMGSLGYLQHWDNHLILSAACMSPAFTMPWQYWLFITKNKILANFTKIKDITWQLPLRCKWYDLLYSYSCLHSWTSFYSFSTMGKLYLV